MYTPQLPTEQGIYNVMDPSDKFIVFQTIGSLNYHLRNGVDRAPWYLCGPNWDATAYGSNGDMFFGEIDPLTDFVCYGSLT